MEKRKSPISCFQEMGRNYWQRPTFAQPIDVLSSGLQRFTSVFGMGTGGATALGSPEGWSLICGCWPFDLPFGFARLNSLQSFWPPVGERLFDERSLRRHCYFFKEPCWFSDICI